jgi:ABC-type polysaccharide/polyol phosphate export permease
LSVVRRTLPTNYCQIACVIEVFKCGFLGSGSASVSGLVYTTAFTIVTLSVGVLIFNISEHAFVVVV